MNVVQALVWNVGTCRLDVKGESSSRDPARARVPMQGTGADDSVVALKVL